MMLANTAAAETLPDSAATALYSRNQPVTVAPLNGIDIAYKTVGETDDPPVLMVMGLTASHRLWGEDVINGLVASGYRVILFDNRDTGDSSFLDELGTPMLWWEFLKSAIGFDIDAPYSLQDMAADGIAVLDQLNIERAHVVGASMGGMISQVIAAEHGDRALSLVSIMSTTGAPHLPEPEDQASETLLEMGSSDGDAAARLHGMGISPEAMPRQLLAIMSAGDRSAQVSEIAVPTLVLHGEDDTLLQPEHGQHTHELITGSKFVVYEEMGHNMPAEVVPELVAEMVNHFTANDPDRQFMESTATGVSTGQ
jgi:pimeloyl-ACP methyl ester carboxylesterase